ncbi:hypothetical protein ADK59_21225 [Streptomyces sp. XY332]|nr:hypothetical protein ADK59_21225 [Streptomyces sp. XY332]
MQAVVDHGLGDALATALPTGNGLWALLAIALVAAMLANLINNLPATLALLPLAAPAGPGPVLAVLIGVNIGPNLTYVGSLATEPDGGATGARGEANMTKPDGAPAAAVLQRRLGVGDAVVIGLGSMIGAGIFAALAPVAAAAGSGHDGLVPKKPDERA